MKTESNLAYILRLTVTLLIITALVAAALAGVNAITKPRIDAIQVQKTQDAIEAVLPGGGEPVSNYTDESGMVQAVYASDTGYAIQVAPSGFAGNIVMMVGVGKDGKVLNISVISQSETAGLGAVIAANTSAGESFRNQFAGATGELAVSKDGGSIDAITSATISSRAVVAGVNAAIACAAGLG